MVTATFQTYCPGCGEPVKASWRICPACEMRLQALTCPLCREEVKAAWRRCPECEAVLLCPACGRRFGPGENTCPRCGHEIPEARQTPSVYSDPVCGMEFILMPGGLFSMGDTLGEGIENETPVHEVVLDGFYMARYPVTQAQWNICMEGNPSGVQLPENPVEQVTWQMACGFADRLTASVGGEAVFSLPTEAQWEYAARSGGRDELYAGGADIDAVAWYGDNSGGRPHPVGRKKPNGLGLYDMSGNVWEWCRDVFQEGGYGLHERNNPVISDGGHDRVIRGGGWNLDAWSARCARRSSLRADFSGPALGFRLVMTRQDSRGRGVKGSS